MNARQKPARKATCEYKSLRREISKKNYDNEMSKHIPRRMLKMARHTLIANTSMNSTHDGAYNKM